MIHVSMPFSQIIPPSPSPTESKRLFCTSVFLLLSHIQGYRYHLSKFHIYALVYCIAGRNINNLRYADDTSLMAESEEELKSLLMQVKEESEKVGLKLNIQKMKIMVSGPILCKVRIQQRKDVQIPVKQGIQQID